MIATRAQKSAMATLINMKKKYNFFYLTRPLLLGEVPHPLLNTLASPKSFTLGNVQMHLTLLSLARKFAPFGVARDYPRNKVAII